MKISGKGPFHGQIRVPGDKSISHRAVMFGSIADGTTRIRGFLESADCLSTINCFRSMGIEISQNEEEILIHGKGLYGLSPSKMPLDAGNSGTTTRLISGILAGQPFETVIDGDASLRSRPMKRIMDPLTLMGADIRSLSGNGCLPLRICPANGDHLRCNVRSDPAESASCDLLLFPCGFRTGKILCAAGRNVCCRRKDDRNRTGSFP